ncbi:hypothetical protein HUJ04_009106 [Dendroctonus ponderosae]|nr:hypothetical protein HUJ04_009106 [Dendroctonus ponderosae]
MEFSRCRLCLEMTDHYVEIFHETFPDMIHKLTGFQIEPEDGLPTTSCLQCHQEVKSAMLTRYQILNSHKILMDEVKFNVEKYVEYVLNTSPAEMGDTKKPTSTEETSPKLDKAERCEDLSHTKNEPSDPQLVPVGSLASNESKVGKCEITANLMPAKSALSRRRPTRKTPNKEIKFRKKRINRQKSVEEKSNSKEKLLDRRCLLKCNTTLSLNIRNF